MKAAELAQDALAVGVIRRSLALLLVAHKLQGRCDVTRRKRQHGLQQQTNLSHAQHHCGGEQDLTCWCVVQTDRPVLLSR